MKTIVTLPTYNEKDNIKEIINRILSLKIKDLEIIVIDDNSPDQTANIVKDLNNPKVHLLLRKGKRGRGLAGIAGFKKALEKGADYIFEMDADFSHDPKYIPAMLKEIKNNDIVIGSRLVEASKDADRTPTRKIITNLSNAYIRSILNLKVRDCNSGYRCFKRKVLQTITPTLTSEDPYIVQELLYKAHLKNYKIKEIPIEFKDRKHGKSKFSIKQVLKGFYIIIKLKLTAKNQT